MKENWMAQKEASCNSWHTWHNDSVLSHVIPGLGLGIRLCVKDYKNAAFLENILIGEDDSSVIPKAHAYDDSYTELEILWKENHFSVQSAVLEGDLYVLVTCKDSRVKASSLIVQGLSLYNLGGSISKVRDIDNCGCTEKADENTVLLLSKGKHQIPVYVTSSENGELFVPLTTPYLAVDLVGEIGISTGQKKSLSEICDVIARQKKAYEKSLEKWGDKATLYQAMQTCQAWDTIYDPVSKGPITTVSRIWNKQWGGYVLFCWDTYFGALMQGLDNKVLAYSNVFAITNTITKEGFVPNYACQNGFKSFDRSQPPVGSRICMKLYERYQEKWFLQEVFHKLLRWNRWFIEKRSTENGLLSWGSNPYELYYDHHLEHDGIGDWQGASYESGLDNSPMYEAIPFDKERYIFKLDDVGLTGLYIQDCYSLAQMAEVLMADAGNEVAYECASRGTSTLAEIKEELLARARGLEEKLEALWDEETGLYLHRRTDTGAFEKRLSPFHFHALYSRQVSDEKKQRMLKEHLLNPKEFWTPYPLPSIAKSDPSYVKQTYWQGRVWAPMNYLVFDALQVAGCHREAKMLAEKSAQIILKEWLECGHVHENYDPETAEGCNNPRSDRFYHWGGLLAYMSLT